jgi:nucleoside-diphosphate-sugar epimerase
MASHDNHVDGPILITGAAGFVGANVLRRVATTDAEVHALVPAGADLWRITDQASRISIHEGDLVDRVAVERSVRAIRPRVIFHLAAHGAYPHQTDAPRIVRSNLEGTINLLDACAHAGFSAFVHSGSSSEYGIKHEPMREDMRLDPNSLYAVAKAAATLYCRHVAVSRQLPVITVRFFSAYGPWEEPGRFVPTLLSALLDGTLPPLVTPTTARDFIYVDDVVEACLATAARAPLGGEILNVGTGVQRTVREAVDTAMSVAGVSLEPRWASMPGRSWDADTWIADASHLQQVTGFRARHDLRDGLSRTLDWLRTHRDRYVRHAARAVTEAARS